jgi:hypothetical protein
MAIIIAGEATFEITPSLGPRTDSTPSQPVTSFGSVSGAIDIDLNGASIQMVTLGNAPEAKYIDELASDLWLLGDFPMRYRVWAVWQDFDKDGDNRISFQAVTYERIMNRRLVGAGGLAYTNTDVGTIVWNAIQHSQAKAGGDLGLTAGTIATGVLASIDWEPGENIGQSITELMKATGCYWVVDADRAVNVYVRADTTPKTQPIGLGINLHALQRASGGANFADSVYMSGSTATVPVFEVSATVATDPRGLWEVAVARPTETLQAGLDTAAEGELAERFQALSRWNATYITEHWIGASRIKPGDWAILKVPPTLAGPLDPIPTEVLVECVSMSMQFNGDGGLEVKVVLEERSS